MKNEKIRLLLSFISIVVVNIAAMISTVTTNVSISNIRGELELGVTETQWIGLCFLIGLALMVPVADFLGKKHGYKKIFCIGIYLFVIGDLLSSFSPTYSLFLPARGISGLGAGFIFPLSLTLVNKEYHHRGSSAIAAYIALSFGLGMSLGPLITGYLTELYSWRIVFHVVFILGTLGFLGCYFFVQEFSEEHDATLDVKSVIRFCGIAFSILLILINARAPWNTEDWRSYFMISQYFLLLISILFLRHSLKTAKHPLFDPSIFKIRTFTLCTIAIFIVGGHIFSSVSSFSNILYTDFGWPKSQIGKILSPFGLTLAVFGLVTASITKYTGLRAPSLVGMSLIITGNFVNHYLTIHSDHVEILAPLLLRAAGIGVCLGPLTALALKKITGSSMGIAAVIITISRQLGTTYGNAMIDLITTVRTVLHTQRFGEQLSQEQQGLREYRRFIDFDFMHNAPDTNLEASKQSLQWVIDYTKAQAHILAVNDAFFIFGIILGISTSIIGFFTVKYYLIERKNQPSQ